MDAIEVRAGVDFGVPARLYFGEHRVEGLFDVDDKYWLVASEGKEVPPKACQKTQRALCAKLLADSSVILSSFPCFKTCVAVTFVGFRL